MQLSLAMTQFVGRDDIQGGATAFQLAEDVSVQYQVSRGD
jgi:hypothetical protein